MPNWCENNLIIEGNKEDMKELLDLTTKEFDFDRIVPMPEHQENNWYDWNNNNWGTKWNARDVNFEYWEFKDGMTYEFNFLTAWSPPIPIVDALMFKFPKLDINLKYSEPGLMYAGEYGTDGDIQFTEEEAIAFDIERCSEFYEDNIEEYANKFYKNIYKKFGFTKLLDMANSFEVVE